MPAGEVRSLRWLPVVGVTAVALVLALPAAALSGATEPLILGVAGPLVRWGQVVIGVIHNIAAATTIGLLLVGGFLTPESRTSRRRETAAVSATITAGVWAVATLASLLVGFAEVSTVALGAAGYWQELLQGVQDFELVRLWTIEVVMVLVLVLLTSRVRTRAGLAWATALGVAALVPISYTGHSSSAEGHETAVTALGLHLLGITVWVGGLLAVLMLRPRWARR